MRHSFCFLFFSSLLNHKAGRSDSRQAAPHGSIFILGMPLPACTFRTTRSIASHHGHNCTNALGPGPPGCF